MAEAAENLPENAFDLLMEDLGAIYKTDPTIGTAKRQRCEIHVNMQEQKFTKAVKERFDLAPESGVPENNAKNIKELRDKLAKFTFN